MTVAARAAQPARRGAVAARARATRQAPVVPRGAAPRERAARQARVKGARPRRAARRAGAAPQGKQAARAGAAAARVKAARQVGAADRVPTAEARRERARAAAATPGFLSSMPATTRRPKARSFADPEAAPAALLRGREGPTLYLSPSSRWPRSLGGAGSGRLGTSNADALRSTPSVCQARNVAPSSAFAFATTAACRSSTSRSVSVRASEGALAARGSRYTT